MRASRSEPAPLSLVFMTVMLLGVVRSSSNSSRGTNLAGRLPLLRRWSGRVVRCAALDLGEGVMRFLLARGQVLKELPPSPSEETSEPKASSASRQREHPREPLQVVLKANREQNRAKDVRSTFHRREKGYDIFSFPFTIFYAPVIAPGGGSGPEGCGFMMVPRKGTPGSAALIGADTTAQENPAPGRQISGWGVAQNSDEP